jgi:hypothetical protein
MGRSGAVAAGLAAGLAALLAVGCGDDGGGGGTATSSVITVDPGAAPFCDAFGGLLVGPLAEGGFDPGDPAALAEAVDATRALVDDLRATAPPAIAAAAGEVADAYDEAFAVLDRYGYDLARVEAEATPAEQAALDGFGRPLEGPGVEDPYDAVEAFVADRCAPGITIPPDLTG